MGVVWRRRAGAGRSPRGFKGARLSGVRIHCLGGRRPAEVLSECDREADQADAGEADRTKAT